MTGTGVLPATRTPGESRRGRRRRGGTSRRRARAPFRRRAGGPLPGCGRSQLLLLRRKAGRRCGLHATSSSAARCCRRPSSASPCSASSVPSASPSPPLCSSCACSPSATWPGASSSCRRCLLAEVVFFRKWCSTFCPISALMSLVGKANRTFVPAIDNAKCRESAGRFLRGMRRRVPPGHQRAAPRGRHELLGVHQVPRLRGGLPHQGHHHAVSAEEGSALPPSSWRTTRPCRQPRASPLASSPLLRRERRRAFPRRRAQESPPCAVFPR